MRNNRNATNTILPIFMLFAAALVLMSCGPTQPNRPQLPAAAATASTAIVTCVPDRMPIPDARRLELILSCLDDIKDQNQRIIEQNDEIITLLRAIRDRLP